MGSLPQHCFPPSSVLLEDPIQNSRFSKQSAEDCIVILPVQGPLLTAVLPFGTSTRPLTFYPQFLLHLPEFLIFLCQATALGCRMFSGVLCSCLPSVAFPSPVLWLLRPNSHLSEVLPCLSTFLPFAGGSGPSILCGPSGGHVCSCTQLSCSAVSSLMTKSSSSGSFSVWDSLSFQPVRGANPFPEDFADR